VVENSPKGALAGAPVGKKGIETAEITKNSPKIDPQWGIQNGYQKAGNAREGIKTRSYQQ